MEGELEVKLRFTHTQTHACPTRGASFRTQAFIIHRRARKHVQAQIKEIKLRMLNLHMQAYTD